MSVSLCILLVAYIAIMILKGRIQKRVYDIFFFVMSPYVFIILINNLFMTRLGFDPIPTKIINVHTVAMLCFFLGNVVAWIWANLYKPVVVKRQNHYHKSTLIALSICVIVLVGIGRFLLIRKYGLKTVFAMGDQLTMPFIFEHLSLMLTPLSILLFDSYLTTKKPLYLLLFVFALALKFLSFVKYHIISTVLAVLIYTSYKNKKLVKKIGLAALILVFGFFVVNYAINFLAMDTSVNSSFYALHAWKYVGGSTVNIQNAIQTGYLDGKNLSITQWVWGMLTSFPNMLLNRFGISLSTYKFSDVLPMWTVALGEESNVISVVGSAYIQDSFGMFIAFCVIWGFVLQFIYERIEQLGDIRSTLVGSAFQAYNMLSFFSCILVLSNPWETMVLSALTAWLVTRFRVPGIVLKSGSLRLDGG